jgi:actin-related protein
VFSNYVGPKNLQNTKNFGNQNHTINTMAAAASATQYSVPMQQMLCGDEVKAAIVDLGSYKMRFGTAGQDLPRHVFRSDCGYVDGRCNGKDRKGMFGDVKLRCISENVEILNPFHVQDNNTDINWDMLEDILQYGLVDCMRIDPLEYPIFFAESYFKCNKNKGKIIELMFETFGSPSCYMASNAALATFSAGRSTSLVVDYGATSTRITPVIDGYALSKSAIVTNRGGNTLNEIVRNECINTNIRINPWYEHLAAYKTKKPTISLREMFINDIINDLKSHMCFIPHRPMLAATRDTVIQNLQIPPYELPDGTMISHSDFLCTLPERIFYKSSDRVGKRSFSEMKSSVKIGVPPHMQEYDIQPNEDTLTELVFNSLCKCDVDSRKDLIGNLVPTGGGSLIDGITQRLTWDLTENFLPSIKCKPALQMPMERQHGAWIGGSILSICGSFQQLWISKAEYQEYGNQIISNRLLH